MIHLLTTRMLREFISSVLNFESAWAKEHAVFREFLLTLALLSNSNITQKLYNNIEYTHGTMSYEFQTWLHSIANELHTRVPVLAVRHGKRFWDASSGKARTHVFQHVAYSCPVCVKSRNISSSVSSSSQARRLSISMAIHLPTDVSNALFVPMTKSWFLMTLRLRAERSALASRMQQLT